MQLRTSDFQSKLNALYKCELNKVGGASMMSVNILVLKRSIVPDLIVNRLLRSGGVLVSQFELRSDVVPCRVLPPQLQHTHTHTCINCCSDIQQLLGSSHMDIFLQLATAPDGYLPLTVVCVFFF